MPELPADDRRLPPAWDWLKTVDRLENRLLLLLSVWGRRDVVTDDRF